MNHQTSNVSPNVIQQPLLQGFSQQPGLVYENKIVQHFSWSGDKMFQMSSGNVMVAGIVGTYICNNVKYFGAMMERNEENVISSCIKCD